MKQTKGNDRIQTPIWAARDMILHFKPLGIVLEPFRGGGVFTKLLPEAEWCEIDDGRDFFERTEPADWIITNPPYSKIRKCFQHSIQLANHVVFLVPLWKVFSAFGLLKEAYEYGGIREIRVYGTGGKLGFPMGNAVGAVYFCRNWGGPTTWTFIKP